MPQLVGQRCVLCEQRIMTILDGRFCKACSQAVHDSCAKSDNLPRSNSHCPACGGNPSLRLSPDFAAGGEKVKSAIKPTDLKSLDLDEVIEVPENVSLPKWARRLLSLFLLKNIKLSQLTVAGWLLVFLSVPVMVLIGFWLAWPLDQFLDTFGEPSALLIRAAGVIAAIPSILVGIALFFIGKWLLEKKLKISVTRKRSEFGNRGH